MVRAIVLLLIGTLATPSYGQGPAELGPNKNEHPFQCGAAFAIMAKVYQEAGDANKAGDYQTKLLSRLKAFSNNLIDLKAVQKPTCRSM
ncbi:hypothetical protein ELI00_37435 [Rhizobium ruizarguesonis]|uniref:hypothetical protein n=1 Tax=Rhizobium ruizarguesonis TaxID=2081791 RepID=UPI001030D9EA|nr:hypothetical protein [Rhizobium ruizarguesonis]TAX63335.1 hypothetical protein ELI00_37435 [Rhizobium ruizarguesonis]